MPNQVLIRDVLRDTDYLAIKLLIQYGDAGEPYRKAMKNLCEQVVVDLGYTDISELRHPDIEHETLSPKAAKLFERAQEIRRDTLDRITLGEVEE